MAYVDLDTALEEAGEKLCACCPATWRECGQTFCRAEFPSEDECPRHWEYLEIKEAYDKAAKTANEVIGQLYREVGAA